MAGRNLGETNISDDDEVDYNEINDTGYLSDDDRGLRIDDDIYVPPPPKISGANVDQSHARLVIKKIVNTNFKSYANEVIIGPFNERFSAIVGPNGSGKSNVIDSMLFVFGFRANRIRSKRISELIHSSNEHPNVKNCTVTVHFHKIIDRGVENDVEIVPNSDIVISKTAFKDNTSFYELNGRRVLFKEVSKLLRDEGIDLDHNRFLILQGEVEQIALMKPKAQTEHDCGMLEFLEDIIGTSRYKLPLEQVAAKVELLSEQVVEKFNRQKIVEHERDQLKGSMEEAVNYMRNENNIVKLKHKLLHCMKVDAENNLKAEESRQQEIVDDYNKLKTKIVEISEEKKLKSSEYKEKSESSAAIQEKSDTIRSHFDKIRKKDSALHAELVETNKRRKANMASVKNEAEKLEQLKKIPEKNTKAIEEYEVLVQKHIANLAKEEAVLKRLMSSLKEKTEPLLKKRSELETKLIGYRKNIDQAKATYDIADAQLKLYTSVEQMEKEKLDKLQETYRQTLKTLEDRKTQLANFETAIPTADKNLIKNRKKLEEMKMMDAKLSADIKQMRIHLQEQKSAMTMTKSRNRVINALMQEKREERIPGIFGRLGDLGAIEVEYDVAISTACGALDNVVVDTVETAQKCIEFLRVNNVGRATFIALEKMKRFIPYCKRKIHAPENVPRLFDLIRVEDERILPAFYYGIQDTLVAKDLDQATRIAYGAKRHRVVTLKGELIETSGTMSGGGRSMMKGRMGQSVVKTDISASKIEKREKNLEKVNAEILELRMGQKPLEQLIEKSSAELKMMTINRNKFQIEVKTLNQQLPVLKAQIKNQEKKVGGAKSNPGRVKELEEAVEEAKKGLDEAQDDAKDVQDKVAKVNKEIDVVNGDAVKQQQKKIADLTKSIDKAKSEICRLQVAIKTSERNVKKAEQKIENTKGEVENCEKRLRDIQEEKKKCETDAKELLEKLEKYEESLKEREEVVKKLKEEWSSLQKREDKMKSLKIDLDQKLVEVKKSVSRLAYHVEESKKKISHLKLNKIPGEEVETLENLNEDQVKALSADRLAERLAAAKEQLPEAIPNMQVISDYMAKDKICAERMEELSRVTNERNKIRATFGMLKKRRFDEFLAGFGVITSKLKEMYQMITLGGAADLEFVDTMDPFAEGIVFSVRPPKKSWKNISNLSGGEKTLSSLALVFALHHYKPTPLYFMDEIDAALDFKNVSIVGTYIKERTKNAQFIVISLRSEMFELADSLIGIYKVYNATKCIPFNMINFYKQYPHLLAREKERRDKAIVNIQRRITQVSGGQQNGGASQRLNLTCPPKLLDNDNTHNSSDISLSKSKVRVRDSLPEVRVKNGKIAVRRTISFSPPSKKMRRFVPRRKMSTSSEDLSSSSSTSSSFSSRNLRNSELCKKRKKDVIN